MIALIAIAVGVVAFDQITKWLVLSYLADSPGIQIVPGCLRLEYAENTGGAFSLLADKPMLLTGLAAVAVLVIVVFAVKTPPEERLMRAALMMMIGGAVANLFDRLYHGFVVDFILAYVGRHAWPTFNVADSFISVGAALVIWRSFTMPNPATDSASAPAVPQPAAASAPKSNPASKS